MMRRPRLLRAMGTLWLAALMLAPVAGAQPSPPGDFLVFPWFKVDEGHTSTVQITRLSLSSESVPVAVRVVCPGEGGSCPSTTTMIDFATPISSIWRFNSSAAAS